MSKVSTSDFQKGMFIIFHGEPNQIVDLTFVNPGKGSAFVRTKLKSLSANKVVEFTYKSGETVDEYPVNVSEMQYLYKTGDGFMFMDNGSYEQYTIAKEILGNFTSYLKVGETYQIMVHDNQAVGMRFPKKVRLAVTEADAAVKGNTVSGAKKLVTLETGARLPVPLFIRKGDTIGINPETGEYVDRASKE
jgi:elongation factor P